MSNYRVDTTVKITAKCSFGETEEMEMVYRDTFQASQQSDAVYQAREKYKDSDIKNIVCY
jgi:hypothetical protein